MTTFIIILGVLVILFIITRKNKHTKVADPADVATLESKIIFETKNGNDILEKLANEGNTMAQYNMGTMHFKNHEYSKAKYWFEKAAENGDTESKYQLGNMYLQGIGLKQDYSKAFYWYKDAAQNNHPEAQYNIGFFYVRGIYVRQDDDKATEWFEKSANNGYQQAIDILREVNEQ